MSIEVETLNNTNHANLELDGSSVHRCTNVREVKDGGGNTAKDSMGYGHDVAGGSLNLRTTDIKRTQLVPWTLP